MHYALLIDHVASQLYRFPKSADLAVQFGSNFAPCKLSISRAFKEFRSAIIIAVVVQCLTILD